jgi:acetyl-CoA C-acetyltransferase
MLAWPLRSLEVVESRAFGGAALILASEERAKALSDSPIWITGFGMGTNSVNVGDAVRMSALQKAAKAAYKMAGIQDPAHEVHVVELNDPFSPWELAACEALGLCGTKGTVELVREGITSVDGKLPVNPSGGTLCTNAPNSGGIFRTIQAAMYLRNGPHGNARKGLVHDSDMSIGLIGDSHALMVIERVE